MKTIRSTNGYSIQVDDCHYEYLNQFNWSMLGNQVKYACSRMGNSTGKMVYMHVWVAAQAGLDMSNDIDHKDRNPLNNQLSNLRAATRSQNCANSKKDLGATCEYRGVYFERRSGKYKAQINIDNKKRNLGRFRDPVQAAKKYDEVAFTAWGDFATLNFPEDYQ